jgi:glycosyltransferase involved in cell wall biosynthesis
VNSTAPAVLLDLSRLLARAGRLPTGVDRVELAYLRHFLGLDVPVFALARTAYGYVLLDRAGMQAMWARFSGTVAFGAVDILSRLRPGLGPAGQAAQSECRRFALARALPHRLGRMLAKHLPQGCHYFNTGHSNLSHRVLRALKLHVGARVVVMVHDTIPLDFPQFQRPGTPQAFAAMLARVRQMADVILCNSHQTKADIARHTPPGTALPRCVVAPLGIDVPRPAPSWPKPPALAPDRPYFMAIGTIEPRKNHEFLLRIWAEMAQQGGPLPALLICGARGWNNAQVFAQLDGHPMMGQHVFELNCLADAQMAAALQGAAALLHPSHAEGYGLPPIEAAALGVPVVCPPLPIYREILGQIPVYAEPQSIYSWIETIRALAGNGAKDGAQGQPCPPFSPPTWQAHFNVSLNTMA